MTDLLFIVGAIDCCHLQVWLQEFAWTSRELPQKITRRNASMAPQSSQEIKKEPMFCVATMLTCLYWSLLVYDFKEVPASPLASPSTPTL